MSDDLVQRLRNWCQAYPTDVFPVPPEHLRAKDSIAADVLREMALPMFAECADRIEALETELRLVAETCAGTGGEYWMGTAEPGPILAQMYREALDA